MDQFAPYAMTIVSISIFVILGLILGPLSAAQKNTAGLAAGSTPDPDYQSNLFRLERAYQNASETVGWFTAAAVMAMIAGVSPVLVNILALIFLISRIFHLAVHLRGIGAQALGMRTYLYTGGWLGSIILAAAAIYQVTLG